ncbi:putative 4-hydroxybenzoate polyprenyl transferase [Xylariomycetidae sp. FL2044]|nr:putative 4-hydroxybenzoate polyprenyl transferase [Xylariomycetidae sp. FL2044]
METYAAHSDPQLTPMDDRDTNFFPHLQPYSHPTTGVLSKLPASWVPYAQLMRIDKPGGLYAFYFPYLIGLSYAASVGPRLIDPRKLIGLAVGLLPFSVVLRGVACTWNDTVDQDFDRRVERCRHRPVARRAVSTSQALLFTAAQLIACYIILSAYDLPPACVTHSAISIAMFFVYALMKRVTYYPQVVLGFPFAWAIPFCVAALGMEPFGFPAFTSATATTATSATGISAGNNVDLGPLTLMLFFANVSWTITYDTIYAHQDVADDEKAGVKGMAMRFRHSTKLLAGVLTVAQCGLLAACGLWLEFGPLYFLCTVVGVAAGMAYFIYDVDLSRPESCGAWFHDQFWIVGPCFMMGFAGEYLMRLLGQ